MKTTFNFKFDPLAASLVAALAGCGGDDAALDDAQPVIDGYAANVHAAYGEALAKAEALRGAVDALVAAPSANTLAAARTAWLAAREPHGQTEAFRFYDGPIDLARARDGLLPKPWILPLENNR